MKLNINKGGRKLEIYQANTPKLTFARMIVHVHAHAHILSLYLLYVNGNAKNGFLLLNGTQYASLKMEVCSTQGQNRAVRITQGGRGCHPHLLYCTLFLVMVKRFFKELILYHMFLLFIHLAFHIIIILSFSAGSFFITRSISLLLYLLTDILNKRKHII